MVVVDERGRQQGDIHDGREGEEGGGWAIGIPLGEWHGFKLVKLRMFCEVLLSLKRHKGILQLVRCP